MEQQSSYRPPKGVNVYISSPDDKPGVARSGEPLPRPFVVATLPYAKWLILESSAERVATAEAELATAKAELEAMDESSQRNAALADGFEKLLVDLQAKNSPAARQVTPLEESEESWQASAALLKPQS